jgi:toxin-antitoxin system PIN domain toxin
MRTVLLPDVNVLIYAFIREAHEHERYRDWLHALVNGDEPFGISHHVCSGFLRIVTNPRIYTPPASIEDALEFIELLLSHPLCTVVSPGARHWEIFAGLCRTSKARGNLVPDAYFAALAIESGNEWVTTDGDYGRFPGLRWRRPF